MSVHRYDRRSVWGDLRRAGMGLVLTTGPMVLVGDNAVVRAVLGALAVLFLVFGLRTVVRGLTLVYVTEHGLSSEPLGARNWRLPGLSPRRIAWRDIRMVGLRFFSLKRDRSEGWMELSLRNGGGCLRLDSNLDGFRDIVGRAVDAARANGSVFSESTRANLSALGIRMPGGSDGS